MEWECERVKGGQAKSCLACGKAKQKWVGAVWEGGDGLNRMPMGELTVLVWTRSTRSCGWRMGCTRSSRRRGLITKSWIGHSMSRPKIMFWGKMIWEQISRSEFPRSGFSRWIWRSDELEKPWVLSFTPKYFYFVAT